MTRNVGESTLSERPIWVFDDFELDLRAWRLSRAGRPLPVEPKGLALLALLIERQGEVVTKNEILDAVWADASVTENAMVRVVAHVRAVLDDDPKTPKYLETVHTRGYRFIAPLTRRDAARSAPRGRVRAAAVVAVMVIGAALLYVAAGRRGPSASSPAAGATSHPSIAILPLENLGAAGHQYFADGMTDALITQLTRVEALKVIAHGAVVRYKSERPAPSVIARELGVASMVEGSVLLAGEHVRITARLVDGATDRTVWGESYEGEVKDILALQGRVARAIVREIRARVTPAEETRLSQSHAVTPAAYQEYLRGLYEYEHSLATGPDMFSSLAEATRRFQSAVALEPAWGEARGALASAHLRLGNISDNRPERRRAYQSARDVAERALELDPGVVSARLALAHSGFMLNGDWEAAEHQYREVLRLEPNSADMGYAMLLTYAGRFDEAAARQRYVLERDPTSSNIRFWSGVNYVCGRRYDDAVLEARELRDRLGDDLQASLIEALVMVRTGRHAEAIGILESRRAALLVNHATTTLLALAYAAVKAGDPERTRRAVQELRARGGEPGPPLLFAQGDVAGAVALIEARDRQRDFGLLQARCWAEYDSLRQIPAVRTIFHRLGITEPG